MCVLRRACEWASHSTGNNYGLLVRRFTRTHPARRLRGMRHKVVSDEAVPQWDGPTVSGVRALSVSSPTRSLERMGIDTSIFTPPFDHDTPRGAWAHWPARPTGKAPIRLSSSHRKRRETPRLLLEMGVPCLIPTTSYSRSTVVERGLFELGAEGVGHSVLPWHRVFFPARYLGMCNRAPEPGGTDRASFLSAENLARVTASTTSRQGAAFAGADGAGLGLARRGVTAAWWRQ